MPPITDHPLRYALANELHARPFPVMQSPGVAVFLALKSPRDAIGGNRQAERAHLLDLLDRFGAPHPRPEATHYSGEIGQYVVKWEQHTEFTTYTIYAPRHSERAFDPAEFDVFPVDWLAASPGRRMTSILIRLQDRPEPEEITAHLRDWFVAESLAASEVLDGAAIVAADFRINAVGHQRMAVFATQGTGPHRLGRVVQRLCEIETYKAMSMLGFHRARALQLPLGAADVELTNITRGMQGGDISPEDALDRLLASSAEVEGLIADTAFRFGATGAYEAIVNQRIEVLRETRFEGLQTFCEFMMRRYEPAMRTVNATRLRLQALTDRAARVGVLLRTKVEVARSEQNQALLESMDRRADLQVRLQKTVEGLSVVAISYYAVSLAGYLFYPLAGPLGTSKGMLMALATIPVVAAVWFVVHAIRNKME